MRQKLERHRQREEAKLEELRRRDEEFERKLEAIEKQRRYQE